MPLQPASRADPRLTSNNNNEQARGRRGGGGREETPSFLSLTGDIISSILAVSSSLGKRDSKSLHPTLPKKQSASKLSCDW